MVLDDFLFFMNPQQGEVLFITKNYFKEHKFTKKQVCYNMIPCYMCHGSVSEGIIV